MFKSKGFTIAFSVLAVLIVLLSAVLGYLIFSDNASDVVDHLVPSQTTPSQTPEMTTEPTTESTEATTTPAPTETTTTETTEPPVDYSLRHLEADEDHKYPVLMEDIPEKGVLTIVRPGDKEEGLVFHKLPRFDSEKASGNLVNFSGSFDIVSKIYIIENGRPFLMYKTDDGYYVTSSDYYISYKADKAPATEKDVTKVISYGYNEPYGIVVTVHHDDGNTMALSFYDYDVAKSTTVPLLTDIIAEYDSEGKAHFEYHNTDGNVYEGVVSFDTPEDGYTTKQISIMLEAPLPFASGETLEITLHN